MEGVNCIKSKYLIFIRKTLSAAVRSKGLIVLNAASSGIVTLLLPSGRTTHSTLTDPIEINEASSLTIEKDSPRADLVTPRFPKQRLIKNI